MVVHDQPRLVRAPAIARRYSVCIRTVQIWMAKGKIPFVRIGSRGLRFSPEACDRALARYEVKEVGR